MGEASVALIIIRISGAWVNPKGAGLGPDLGNVMSFPTLALPLVQ